MVRSLACLALFVFVGPALRAGELDDEFGPKTAPTPSAAIKANDLASTTAARPSALDRAARSKVTKASELDEESPTQSCFFRRRFGWGGWGGYGLGWGGWGGYGLGGYGLGYGLGGYGLGYGLGGYGLGYGLGWGGGWGGWGGGYGLSCFSPFMGYGYSGGWGYW